MSPLLCLTESNRTFDRCSMSCRVRRWTASSRSPRAVHANDQPKWIEWI